MFLQKNRRIFNLVWEVEESCPPGVPSGKERKPNLSICPKQRFIKHLLSTYYVKTHYIPREIQDTIA